MKTKVGEMNDYEIDFMQAIGETKSVKSSSTTELSQQK